MALHLVYRASGGENSKRRPPFYGKTLALQSFLRAAADAPAASTTFLNDGPIPMERLTLMAAAGEVVDLGGVGRDGSMRAALDLPGLRGWAADDVVWLAEDDYLYRPESLGGLVAAVAAFPDASYFGLYAAIGALPPHDGDMPPDSPVPARWRDGEPVDVDGHRWQRALSTTSTFGARVGALAADRRGFDLTMRWCASWDHYGALVYQGFLPYPWRSIGGDGLKPAVRRALLDLAALDHRRPSKRRVLVASEPPLITHMELPWLARGTDWAAVAADTAVWAAVAPPVSAH